MAMLISTRMSWEVSLRPEYEQSVNVLVPEKRAHVAKQSAIDDHVRCPGVTTLGRL
jgi:hypothetical protein